MVRYKMEFKNSMTVSVRLHNFLKLYVFPLCISFFNHALYISLKSFYEVIALLPYILGESSPLASLLVL